ncbi:MAG: DnaA ATPase domain-containing protein, partial [Lachnospirales bacterium]
MNEFKKKWQDVLHLLEPEVTEIAFTTWFLPLKFKSIDKKNNTLYILCDIPFAIDTIKSRYMRLLEGCTEAIFKRKYKIEILLIDDINNKKEEVTEISTTSTINQDFEQELIINPRYTFENFVVGSNNEYAYTASLAVAENPASSYNPLYLYGESGLGKTHLMHAISNYIFNNYLNKKVLYVTSEMFTNEFISALRIKKVNQFRDKYRQMDVLLIDDVKFFKYKDAVKEELFNTFNTLYDNNKQIVISSDRPPKELELDERLRQRFGWNIVADVKKPTYETRMAILEKKAEQENLIIDENIQTVLNMIATR